MTTNVHSHQVVSGDVRLLAIVVFPYVLRHSWLHGSWRALSLKVSCELSTTITKTSSIAKLAWKAAIQLVAS